MMSPADVSDAASVLLVDDRPENLLALEAALEPLKVRTVRARSGEEALLRLLREDFAVVLMDVQMPGLDGMQTAAMIKQRDRSRHLPIIFITATSREVTHQFRAYANGAVDYLLKPVDPDILCAKVSTFVQLYAERANQARHAAIDAEDAARVATISALAAQLAPTLREARAHARRALAELKHGNSEPAHALRELADEVERLGARVDGLLEPLA